MNSKKDITIVAETTDEDGCFLAMILKPISWRFKDCYSVSMVAKDEDNPNKGFKLVNKYCLLSEMMTEFHNTKSTVNFKDLFLDIKNRYQCNFYIINKPLFICVWDSIKKEWT